MSEKAYNEAMAMLKEAGLSPLPVRRPSPDDIMRLEQRLGVTLPRSYRAMLFNIGLLQVDRLEFAGLGNAGLDGKTASNVVFATERYRADGLISKSMIQIGITGYGPFYCIDCAQLDEDDEAPVWEAPGNGVEFGKDKLADSFGDFLLGEVRTLVQDLQEGEETTVSQYWKDRSKDF